MDPSDDADLLLSEQLCFALYSASRAVIGCYRPLLERIGLTYSQYLVMLVLWEHDTVDFARLCTDLHLDSGSLSPVVKRLEANGLVTRHRRPADERTVEVRCTPQGRALHDGARAVQRKVEAATGMSRAEIVRLRDDLNRLGERMRDSADESALSHREPATEERSPGRAAAPVAGHRTRGGGSGSSRPGQAAWTTSDR